MNRMSSPSHGWKVPSIQSVIRSVSGDILCTFTFANRIENFENEKNNFKVTNGTRPISFTQNAMYTI